MANLLEMDQVINREKKRTFCGSFKVFLDKLRPEDNIRAPRQLCEAEVITLLSQYKAEGCHRREPENYIPALISSSDLSRNDFTASNVARKESDDPPILCPDQPLVYLQGKHRLEAGRRFFLSPSEQWWIVNLYSDDLSPRVQDVLRCADPSATKYAQGDIFRQIRISALSNDEGRRQRWLAKLNKNQRYNISRLNAMPDFLASLDSKLSFIGLWAVLKMSMFAWYSRMHCPEELTHYSDRMTKTWTYILGELEDDHLRLDAGTVKILEGRCPYRSSEDRAYIEVQVQAGKLLPAITSPHRRAEILERVYSVPHLIPSLYTLHEDSKALEPPMTILRKILPLPHGRSISQHFAALYEGQDKLIVQTSEFTFEERPTPSTSYSSWASYRQLVLAASRHFPYMGGTAPRIDERGKRRLELGNQDSWWYEISAFALRLKYRSIVKRFPDHKAANVSIIKDFLRRTQPPRYYQTNPENDGHVVQLISQVLVDKSRRDQTMVTPEIVSDVNDPGRSIERRCGRPFESSFQADEGNLFYDYIYCTAYPPHGKYLTSFGVKRDVFHAFFGTIPDKFGAEVDNPIFHQRNWEEPVEASATEYPSSEQALVRIGQPCTPTAAISTIGPMVPGATSRNIPRGSFLTVGSEYSMSPIATPVSATLRVPIDFTEFTVGPWISQAPNKGHEMSNMYMFGQQDAEGDIPFTDASRLLFGRKRRSESSAFTVLSPTINGRFRKRHADTQDTPSMISALNLSSRRYFVAQSNGKWLKMAAPVTILEEARSDRLHTVVAVPRQKVPDLIHQFENPEESEEEL